VLLLAQLFGFDGGGEFIVKPGDGHVFAEHTANPGKC
jgi:hypothetical protein